MKVISFSDVITNSSSEVFVHYDKEGLNTIKDIVNAILAIGESKYTFDDLFTIEFDIDDDYAKELYEDKYDKEPSLEELYDFACEREFIDGFIVKAKDPKYKSAANLISLIDNIFEKEAIFNS